MNHYPTITNVTKQAIIKSKNSFAEFAGFLNSSDVEKLAADKPKWWKSNAWSFLFENDVLGKPLYGFDNGIVFTENAVVLISAETSSYEDPSTIVIRTLYWPYELGENAPHGANSTYPVIDKRLDESIKEWRDRQEQEGCIQLKGILYPTVYIPSKGDFFRPLWSTDVVSKMTDSKGRIRVDAKSVLTTVDLNYVNEDDSYVWGGNLTLPKEKYLKVFEGLADAVRKEQQLKEEELSQKSHTEALEIKTNFFEQFDRGGNGVLDVFEDKPSLLELAELNASTLSALGIQYTHKTVRLCNSVTELKKNIENIYGRLKETEDVGVVKSSLPLLKNQIAFYDHLYFLALALISAASEGNTILFFQVYESLDKARVFDSQWESDVAVEIQDVNSNIQSLMNRIETFQMEVIAALAHFEWNNSRLISAMQGQLEGVKSSLNANVLVNTISAYQLYKLRKGE